MLIELRELVNSERINNWSLTVTLRRAIAEAWKRAFPDKELSQEAKDMLKPYYKDLDF